MRTVLDADNIVVFKNGEVIESGKSKELIKKDGVFTSMYNTQFQSNQ